MWSPAYAAVTFSGQSLKFRVEINFLGLSLADDASLQRLLAADPRSCGQGHEIIFRFCFVGMVIQVRSC